MTFKERLIRWIARHMPNSVLLAAYNTAVMTVWQERGNIHPDDVTTQDAYTRFGT